MTRDEAIKAMREGKIVNHPKYPNYHFELGNDSNIPIVYFKKDKSGRHLFDVEDFLDICVDTGWEIVRQKVKKICWCIVRTEYKSTANLATDKLFLDKKDAERWFPEANGYGYRSIEIEVEE